MLYVNHSTSIGKYLAIGIVIALSMVLNTACQKEEFGPSIFIDTPQQQVPGSLTYAFDMYLHREFLKPYNLEFAYKLKDVTTDMDYNLVPTTLDNSKKLAVLVKYLWYDAYKNVAGSDFLKKYGPKLIVLIGSSGYNPANGTEILGLAEGGIKISLLKVNHIDVANVDMLNEYYFLTMHHEFAHILHQIKSYPADFNLISYKNYDPFTWQSKHDEIAWSMGFVSPYGSSQTQEDFVETIAHYITRTDEQWNTLLSKSEKEWIVDEQTGQLRETTVYSDGINGKAVILQKLNICRVWLKSAWNIDIDKLRAEVQTRQANFDMQQLLSEIK